MPSSTAKDDDFLDFDRDVPTTQEDILALRRARELDQQMTLDEYFRWLKTLPVFPEELSRRRTFEGMEPFEL